MGGSRLIGRAAARSMGSCFDDDVTRRSRAGLYAAARWRGLTGYFFSIVTRHS